MADGFVCATCAEAVDATPSNSRACARALGEHVRGKGIRVPADPRRLLRGRAPARRAGVGLARQVHAELRGVDAQVEVVLSDTSWTRSGRVSHSHGAAPSGRHSHLFLSVHRTSGYDGLEMVLNPTALMNRRRAKVLPEADHSAGPLDGDCVPPYRQMPTLCCLARE